MAASLFVDISSANAAPSTIDWHAYKAWSAQGDGISRVSLKSSEGAGIVDKFYYEYRAGAEAAGIDEIYHYHYARPDLNNSPQQEADYQAANIGAIRARDLVMLDYEGNIQNDPTGFTSEWAYQWLSIQEGRYARLPTIYSFLSFIEGQLQDSRLAKFLLTFTDPTGDPNVTPACPPPWHTYTFLQYSWSAVNIPGIPGKVDADIYRGGEPQSMLTIQQASNYFTAIDDQHWRCRQTDFIVQLGILEFYRTIGVFQYNGLSLLGLPKSTEVTLKPGVALQRYERGVVVYDPQRQFDTPPGVIGPCYLVHIDSLYSQVAQLEQQVATLQQEVSKSQPDPLDAEMRAALTALKPLVTKL